MLVETKARWGCSPSPWVLTCPSSPAWYRNLRPNTRRSRRCSPPRWRSSTGAIVTTKEQSQAAGDKFRAADVDLVILQLLTYATSYNMLPAVRDLDVPVVLVNVQKNAGP